MMHEFSDPFTQAGEFEKRHYYLIALLFSSYNNADL